MDLVDLISNKKYIFPIILEYERTERNAELMAKLIRDHYCVLTKKKLRCLFSSKNRIDLSNIRSFNIDSFLQEHEKLKHINPMIFLKDGKLPDRKFSLIKLLADLPEQRRRFCFNILLSRAYLIDRKTRYEEIYKRKICSSAAEMYMIRSDVSYIPTSKRRLESASKNADGNAEYSGSVTIDPIFSSDALSLEIP